MPDPAHTERWPLAAAGVAGLVLVMLVGGVWLARRAAELPAATPQVVATTTVRATIQATGVVTAAAQPTATAQPTAVPTLQLTTPPLTMAAAAAATPASTPQGQFTIALVNGTPQILPPNATVAPQPTPQEWWNQSNTVSPDQAAELNAFYSRFWQLRAQSLLDLDPGPLAEVTDGPELQRERIILDSLREHNVGEQIDVQHHMRVAHATATDATLIDDYVSRIVPFDLTTNETQASSPSTTAHLAYHLQKLSGTWKVVEAIQLTYD